MVSALGSKVVFPLVNQESFSFGLCGESFDAF